MGLSSSSILFGLAAALPSWSVSCQWLALQEDRIVSSYAVEIRCHTQEGAPVPNVLIGNPESGASGVTDRQGKIIFQIDGYEGTAVSFRVQKTPEGIVPAEESAEHRMVLKSIAGSPNSGRPQAAQASYGDRPGTLRYDIPMRRSRETYVLLVSTRGIGDLPVRANGVTLGKLNSVGAGAFRIHGQPGEELKVQLATGRRPELTQEDPEHTFALPATSAILSFPSTLAPLPGAEVGSSAARPVITFVPTEKKRHHSKRGHKTPAANAAPTSPGPAAPVQVPYRGYEVR